jgi:hypothetical protein
MKLAVLGTDSDALSLVAAAVTAGHQIVWLGDVRPEDAAEMSRLIPGLGASADWESLLDHSLVDAVLVGRGTAGEVLRAEQLKRLVADFMPVLAVHPVGTSVLLYYVLDMARHEVHGVLRHYSPLVDLPSVTTLAEWVQTGSGPIGAVHQIYVQRPLIDCRRDSVIRSLARDVELLSRVAGGVRTVSAVGPRALDATYASLQVQMTSSGAATLRWSLAPATGVPRQAVIGLVGEVGIATLPLSDGTAAITTIVGGNSEVLTAAPYNQPAAAIDTLAAVLPANGTEQSEAASTWQEATAAMEIVDTIELSLQKGRTIEVHGQRLTEQLAFRGTMAAFGCGLLLVTFFALIAAGVLGDVLGVPLRDYWPITLLVVLAVFLSMQALPWLVKRRRRDSDAPNNRSSAAR